MATNAAFMPSGNTITITAATSAPAASQVPSSTLGGNQYRIINASTTQGAFLAWGQNAATAQANAVIPTGNVTFNMLYILPNTDEIMTFVPNAYFTAITTTNSSTIYITPGDGM
jgi:hypothetical protein